MPHYTNEERIMHSAMNYERWLNRLNDWIIDKGYYMSLDDYDEEILKELFSRNLSPKQTYRELLSELTKDEEQQSDSLSDIFGELTKDIEE